MALTVPSISMGQTAFSASPADVSLTGPLPGDQVRPHLSINASGGFLVWEDSLVDGFGMGIRAQALDAGLSAFGLPFRVNQFSAGSQERPRVALLHGGGAVFVWQGGRPGFQRIYARFLSPTNTWLGGDIQVNSFSRNSQITPDVAVLTNGNVIVVWASFNQPTTSSFQDVYGQMFSPTGQKIGGEIAINQFTPFNQRTPAVAALNTGGFVVAWVSEQQQNRAFDSANPDAAVSTTNRPSVDIYMRSYDASAASLTDELLVDTGSDVCANPTVASGADGGFIISWSQKDMRVRNNSWDIWLRNFSSSRVPGPSRLVNSHIVGDQYIPHINADGSDYFVVWTSLGQDGSREGVFGRFVTPAGVLAGPELPINTGTISRQMHPAVAGDGSGRFLAVWSSYVGGADSFDLYGRLFTGASFIPGSGATVYAAPISDPFLATGATGPGTDGSGGAPILSFPSTPPPSVGALTKGTYNGLFYREEGLAVQNSGYFTATRTDKGAFSAKVFLGGKTYAFSGKFDASGTATKTIARRGFSSITVQLQVDVASDQIRGQLTDGSWTAALVSDKLMFSRTKSATSLAGSYTLVIPSTQVAGSPGGDGIATVKVDAGGGVLLTGTLADGTKVAQKSALSRQGVWPLYSSLYRGAGSAMSWIQFTAQADSDLSGRVIWLRPAGAIAKYYPSGFTNGVTAIGSLYVRPGVGAKALQVTDGSLVLTGGGLTGTLSVPFTWNANNKVTAKNSTDKLSFTLTPTTGLFRGSTINPQTRKAISFSGVILEKPNRGSGFFLSTDQSGHVEVEVAP